MTTLPIAPALPARRSRVAILWAMTGQAARPLLPPGWFHAARTTLAAMTALLVAYVLDLDNPVSAAVTVLIVANPVQGMLLSKSLYRIAGTLVGGAMALILAALFAQSPELYLLAFSLWMGLCVIVSTILRSFRSYAAVLAGYTVALISIPGIANDPSQIFSLVTARVSVVVVGIVCSAVVTSILSGRSGHHDLEGRMRQTLRALAAYAGAALAGAPDTVLTADRRRLGRDIATFDSLIEFAALESAEIARLAQSQRAAVAAMLGALTVATSARDALTALPDSARSELAPRRDDLAACFATLCQALDQRRGEPLAVAVADAGNDLARIRETLATQPIAANLPELRARDRLAELIDEVLHANAALVGLIRKRAPATIGGGLSFHVDWRWAAVNGARATLAVWLAAALWILTAWSAGGMMVGAIVPNVGLLSLHPRPTDAAAKMAQGITAGVAIAFFYLLFVLPRISGFPLLALVLSVPIFWATCLTLNPKVALIGIGIQVFFPTLLAPSNPTRYDLATFLNNGIATIAGAALTALVYRLILPVGRKTRIRALARAIRADIQALVRMRRPLDQSAWETRMHDRLTQLATALGIAGLKREGLMRGGFATLRIGREIIRTRALLDEGPMRDEVRTTAQAALASLRRMPDTPQATIRTLHAASKRLARMAAEESGPDAARLAASLAEIAFLLGRYRRFFAPHTLRQDES